MIGKYKKYCFDLTRTLSTISMWFGFVAIDVISRPLASLMRRRMHVDVDYYVSYHDDYSENYQDLQNWFGFIIFVDFSMYVVWDRICQL